MKRTKSLIVFSLTFIVGYIFLSSLGCVFFDENGNHYQYSDILASLPWTVIYSIFIGLWIGIIVADEYYKLLESNEKKNKNAYR